MRSNVLVRLACLSPRASSVRKVDVRATTAYDVGNDVSALIKGRGTFWSVRSKW